MTESNLELVRRGPAEGGDERWANLTTFRDGRVVEMVHYPSVDDAFTAAGSPG